MSSCDAPFSQDGGGSPQADFASTEFLRQILGTGQEWEQAGTAVQEEAACSHRISDEDDGTRSGEDSDCEDNILVGSGAGHDAPPHGGGRLPAGAPAASAPDDHFNPWEVPMTGPVLTKEEKLLPKPLKEALSKERMALRKRARLATKQAGYFFDLKQGTPKHRERYAKAMARELARVMPEVRAAAAEAAAEAEEAVQHNAAMQIQVGRGCVKIWHVARQRGTRSLGSARICLARRGRGGRLAPACRDWPGLGHLWRETLELRACLFFGVGGVQVQVLLAQVAALRVAPSKQLPVGGVS